MSIRTMLRSTATIQRFTAAATSFSDGGAKTWANLYADIACDIQPVSAHESIALGTEQAFRSHKMFCVPGDITGTTTADRVLFNGRYFEIVGVRDVDELGRLKVLDLLERVGVKVD